MDHNVSHETCSNNNLCNCDDCLLTRAMQTMVTPPVIRPFVLDMPAIDLNLFACEVDISNSGDLDKSNFVGYRPCPPQEVFIASEDYVPGRGHAITVAWSKPADWQDVENNEGWGGYRVRLEFANPAGVVFYSPILDPSWYSYTYFLPERPTMYRVALQSRTAMGYESIWSDWLNVSRD